MTKKPLSERTVYISFDPHRPYPWWTKIWPLGRIYFAGWQRGEEAGIRRGRVQMGANYADEYWNE